MTFEQKLFSALRPKRNKPRRKRRGTRRGPWRSEARLNFVRPLSCANCYLPGPSEAAHLHTNGTSSKCSDEFTVPLCHACHDQYDGRAPLPVGRERGHRAFERHYGIDLAAAAREYHRDWVLSHFPEERDECRCEVSGDWKSGDCEYCRSLKVPHYREAGNAEECPF